MMRRFLKRGRRFAALGWMLCLTGASDVPGWGQEAPRTPYGHRALFLLKFAEYIEWPAEAFATGTSPLVLGILGRDPFGKDIENISGQQVKTNRTLAVKYFKRVQEVAGCHLLFIAPSEEKNLAQTFKALGDAPICTVGEFERFLELGGMLNLVPENRVMSFEVDPTRAAKARLKLGAELLDLASKNYELAADYLLNFAQFTEWPRQAVTNQAPFVVGILGRNPFGKEMERIKGKSVRKRKLLVKELTSPAEANGCQILFISSSEKGRALQVLQGLGQASILTVAEIEDFLQVGGMVRFVVGRRAVLFDINQAAAARAILGFDPRVLQLARTVIE